MAGERYTLHARRRGTVHIVRWWEVHLDGELLDAYSDKALAAGYVAYMNEHHGCGARELRLG